MQNPESNNYNLLQIQKTKNNSYSFIKNAITIKKISHIIRNLEDVAKTSTHSSEHDEKTESSLLNLFAQFLFSHDNLNEIQAHDCINALHQIVHNKQCQLAQCKSDLEKYNLKSKGLLLRHLKR